MFSRFSVSVILILAVVVWGGVLWSFGYDLSWNHLAPYTITLTVLTVSLALFDRYLWRKFPLYRFCWVPDLTGTWVVELNSTYKDPKTGWPIPPVAGFASIRQTYSSLSIRLMTECQDSVLVAREIKRHDDGSLDVLGVYQSDPSIHLRGEISEIHYGSFKYKIVGDPPTEMTGHYWTDRKTKGSIRLVRRTPVLFHSFASAQDGIDKGKARD